MNVENLPFEPNGHIYPGREEKAGTVDVLHVPGTSKVHFSGGPYRCWECDERADLQLDGGAVRVGSPCRYPDGITTTITLAVPSGRLIVADDLRPVYAWSAHTTADYNSIAGQAQAVEAMAVQGCAYGPVGNSCPGLYRNGQDRFVIASPGHDDEDNPLLPEADCLANICTDLWAYSIADFEHWKARGGAPSSLGWTDTVIEVPAGSYQFVLHTGERGFDPFGGGTVIFADVQRIA